MGARIIMPSGGQTTSESLVAQWHKKVGDPVRRGDVLFSIETDKATMDVESYGEGVLLAVYHDAGESVATGELMAYVGEAGEMAPGDAAAQPQVAAKASDVEAEDDEYKPIPGLYHAPASSEARAPSAEEAQKTSQAEGKALLASPAARRLAKDGGVDLKRVLEETGRQPIKKNDVERALERRASADCHYIEASPMRRTIARRMSESAANAPQYSVSVDVDMENALALRGRLNEFLKPGGVSVSYNDILMKCACAAISRHPLVNGSFEGDRIRMNDNVHFGLAVGVEGGLVVPVVRSANLKCLAEIAKANAANVEKARAGRLQQEEMAGGTITLSNLGMFGISSFTAIVNSPESCILAVGGILEKPVVRGGALAVGHMMTVTATFDHRLVDGAEGAAFLADMERLLENPELLLA